MAEKQVKILDKPTGIAKKLKGVKFDDAFGTKQITNAETVLKNSEKVFNEASFADFTDLKNYFENMHPNRATSNDYEKIYAIGLSLKSRAGTGGLEVASSVADSLYKYCESAVKKLPNEGYKIIRVHYNALAEIFSGKFPIDDKSACQKLVAGLQAVIKKYS